MPLISGDEVWVLRNRNLRIWSGQECSSHKKNLLCAVRVPGGVNCEGNVCKFHLVQDFLCEGRSQTEAQESRFGADRVRYVRRHKRKKAWKWDVTSVPAIVLWIERMKKQDIVDKQIEYM